MKIETQYNIGDHIWVVYENRGEVCVYDDYIKEIGIDANCNIMYFPETCPEDIKESQIIPYECSMKLIEEIVKIMIKIRKKEEKENNGK